MDPRNALDLLPCPFCGGPAVIDSVGGPNTPFQAECTKCLATGHRAPYEKKAAYFWNRRPEAQAPAPGLSDAEGMRRLTQVMEKAAENDPPEAPQVPTLAPQSNVGTPAPAAVLAARVIAFLENAECECDESTGHICESCSLLRAFQKAAAPAPLGLAPLDLEKLVDDFGRACVEYWRTPKVFEEGKERAATSKAKARSALLTALEATAE